MIANNKTTIDGNIAIHFPAAWKPPQGSTRIWTMAGAGAIEIAAVLLTKACSLE